MPEREREAAGELAERIRFLAPREESMTPGVLQRALVDRRVLRLDYADRHGRANTRVVEPLGFLGGEYWYLVAWCRLRDVVRGFRMDRIRGAEALEETVPPRSVDIDGLDVLGRTLVGLDVTATAGGNTDMGMSRKR